MPQNSEGFDFNIDINFCWDLYLKQNGRCALSGMPIYFELSGFTGKNHIVQDGEASASLNRINSKKGYEIDNIQWLHKHIKLMKINSEQIAFVEMCKSVFTFSQSNSFYNFLQPKVFKIENRAFLKSINKLPKGKYIGVCKVKNRFTAKIKMNQKIFHLGTFETEEAAAKNRDYYAIKMFGNGCY